MKRFVILFFCFLLTGILWGQSFENQFDISGFYDNPFTTEKTPTFFDDYDSFKHYFSAYTFEEKEVVNKYTKEVDKEISVQNDEVQYIYYFRFEDGILFKEWTAISDFKNIKYGFNKEMKLNDIFNICGDDYSIYNHDNTIEMNYCTEDGGEIHFLLNKITKKLEHIVLTI